VVGAAPEEAAHPRVVVAAVVDEVAVLEAAVPAAVALPEEAEVPARTESTA
jgi:hypothetical protein